MNLYQWIKNGRNHFKQPSIVLMYHRVAEPASDPWLLSVGSKNFEQQLIVLKKTGQVVPMSLVTEQLDSERPRSSIVLTFDDGYVDNYFTAKPLLEKYELPATFFISTHHVGRNKEYWWDELANTLLHNQRLPQKLSLDVKGVPLSFDLHEESVLTDIVAQQHRHWDANQAPPTRRSQLYLTLWRLFSPLFYQEQQRLLEELRHWAGVPEQPRRSYCCMSEEQLRELAAGELFNVGAHSVSHPALAYHSEKVQRQEIDQSKQFLENLTGLGINSFAYPSGNFNDTTIKVLREQGFRFAFTTYEQPVKKGNDPYQIGRFHVKDWTGVKFEQILSKWL